MKFQQIRSATSIVHFGGKRFLIDPMLADQGTYPDVPETTSTGRGNPDCDLPCPINSLFDVDAVIVTHLHFDHFDAVAAEVLPKTLTVFSQSEEEAQILRGMGFNDVRLLTADGTEFDGVNLHRTDCDHGSTNLVTLEGYKEGGYSEKASGVVFESAAEPESFYLAGDTIYCQSVVTAVEKFKPGIIAVNAAGAQYPLGHLIIMNQYDVRALIHRFPTLKVIATHVEGVSHATVDRPMLRAFAKVNHLDLLSVPNDGEVLEF